MIPFTFGTTVNHGRGQPSKIYTHQRPWYGLCLVSLLLFRYYRFIYSSFVYSRFSLLFSVVSHMYPTQIESMTMENYAYLSTHRQYPWYQLQNLQQAIMQQTSNYFLSIWLVKLILWRYIKSRTDLALLQVLLFSLLKFFGNTGLLKVLIRHENVGQ